MAEHGGNLDIAIAQFGGARPDWIDISTGINPHAYPIPDISHQHWADLPDAAAGADLIAAAQQAYQTNMPILPMAGAQQAINAYPALRGAGDARILGPTYNEHGLQLARKGWRVSEVASIDKLAGAELAVVVNPNNPDGQRHLPDALLELAQTVGLLIIDESFADAQPNLSVCPQLTEAHQNILVLRSFGKFYGLAGVRLGFAIGADALIQPLAAHQGSWAVSGPALAIGAAALNDSEWAANMRIQLHQEAEALDAITAQAGWQLQGGCNLFRLYDVGDASAWQNQLAKHHIWTRRFSYAPHWLRLGLPPQTGWSRLKTALSQSSG